MNLRIRGKTGRTLLVIGFPLILIAGAFGFAHYNAWEYRRTLTDMAWTLSKDGFSDTEELREVLSYDIFSRYQERTAWVGPFGYLALDEMEYYETGFLYLSKNAALPENRRFRNHDLNKRYQIDPFRSSDEDVGAYLGRLLPR